VLHLAQLVEQPEELPRRGLRGEDDQPARALQAHDRRSDVHREDVQGLLLLQAPDLARDELAPDGPPLAPPEVRLPHGRERMEEPPRGVEVGGEEPHRVRAGGARGGFERGERSERGGGADERRATRGNARRTRGIGVDRGGVIVITTILLPERRRRGGGGAPATRARGTEGAAARGVPPRRARGRGRARGRERAEHARRHLRRQGARGLPRRTFGADVDAIPGGFRARGRSPGVSPPQVARHVGRPRVIRRGGRASRASVPCARRRWPRRERRGADVRGNPTASRLARDARTSPRSLGAARRSVGRGPWRARSPIPTTRRDRRRVVRPARPLAVPTRTPRPSAGTPRRVIHPAPPPGARSIRAAGALARLLRWRPGWITSSSSGGRART